jgi:hypothetical protein
MAPHGTSTEEPRPPVSLNGADWGTSDAKHLIIQDMLDGLVPVDENIKDVRRLFEDMYAHQPEFADFTFDEKCYKARIKGIQAAVKRLQWADQYDTTCLAHAIPRGAPRWQSQYTYAKTQHQGCEVTFVAGLSGTKE